MLGSGSMDHTAVVYLMDKDGRFVAPDEGGLTNFRAPSFDPKTGLFIVDAHPSYGIYFAKPADGAYGWAGADYDLWGKGVIEAIDYQTGKIRWSHEVGNGGSGAGVLNASGFLYGVHSDGDCDTDGGGANSGWSAASIVAASAYLQDGDLADR